MSRRGRSFDAADAGTAWLAFVGAILLAFLLALLSGCGTASPAAQARVSLGVAHQATRSALGVWQREFERRDKTIATTARSCVAPATPPACGRPLYQVRADLMQWRALADRVDAGFRALDEELRAAGLLIKAFEGGTANMRTDELLAGVLLAASGLLDVGRAAGVDLMQWLARIPGLGGR